MIGLVPKNGLGVAAIVSDLGLGETDAEATVEAAGDVVTGLKAFALGFGLNEDAFTFRRLLAAVVGDIGGALLFDGVIAAALPLVDPLLEDWLGRVCRCLGPLNGGIAWMTIREGLVAGAFADSDGIVLFAAVF